jgi:hypothetical protein
LRAHGGSAILPEAMTKKTKLSPRGQRRAAERAAVKLAKDRVRLAELEPGGSAERPLVVDSAAVIEPRAKDTRCAVCESALDLEDHEVVTEAGQSLRRVRLVCKLCHTPRTLWFRLERPMPN